GRLRTINKHGWVRGATLRMFVWYPSPILCVEPSELPSPTRGEGTITAIVHQRSSSASMLSACSNILSRDQSKRHRLEVAADIAGERSAFDAAGAGAGGVKAGQRRAVLAEHARLRIDGDAAHGVGDAGGERDGIERRGCDRRDGDARPAAARFPEHAAGRARRLKGPPPLPPRPPCLSRAWR